MAALILCPPRRPPPPAPPRPRATPGWTSAAPLPLPLPIGQVRRRSPQAGRASSLSQVAFPDCDPALPGEENTARANPGPWGGAEPSCHPRSQSGKLGLGARLGKMTPEPATGLGCD